MGQNLSHPANSFGVMSLKTIATDALEQRLLENQTLRSKLAAEEMQILSELDRRQAATADGCRSLSEWVAARCDVSLETARSLVRTMRRIEDRPDLHAALASGEATFDRVEALSKLPDDVGLLLRLDVAGVRREAAKRARITAGDEARAAEDQFLVLQPSLDESWWRFWGGLDGYTGSLVDKTIRERADQLPDLPDGSKGSQAWRNAVALGELCVSDDSPPAQLTVFVDATEAVGTQGESGVVLEAGPRVGRQVLAAILCDAEAEVIARSSDGRYLDYGRRRRTATPAQKRALMDRYMGRCAADGCDSRRRLQAHHLTPWVEGGRTDLDDMILLCWFHHQVVVHQRGFEVFRHPEHGRIRFRRPVPDPIYEPG